MVPRCRHDAGGVEGGGGIGGDIGGGCIGLGTAGGECGFWSHTSFVSTIIAVLQSAMTRPFAS